MNSQLLKEKQLIFVAEVVYPSLMKIKHTTSKQFLHCKKKFTEAELKKIGVDKVELLEQRFCPIYPERIINPNSKTVEYKGKTIYLWSSSAARRWARDADKYYEEAVKAGILK